MMQNFQVFKDSPIIPLRRSRSPEPQYIGVMSLLNLDFQTDGRTDGLDTHFLCPNVRPRPSVHPRPQSKRVAEFLAQKHESRILGQWSNLVSGSRKSQASSLWVKQHRVQPETIPLVRCAAFLLCFCCRFWGLKELFPAMCFLTI